jgi:hypothetical protein
MTTAATYLYADSARYWYSTQPTVTKLAEDRAEQLKSNPDRVVKEIDERLRADLRKQGDFSRVHPMPANSQDVTDEVDARLVVLSVDHPYSKESGNAAETAAKEILTTRGNAPRLYQNTLAFLAVDKIRLQDLDEAVRRYVAWDSILDEAEGLGLTSHQVRQAESQKVSADSVVLARLPEAYQWLIVPTQATPQAQVEWQAFRLSGQDALALRASKKLRNDELLVTGFAASRLKMELDKIPLWRGQHVAVKQVVEDFARYLYLPRLRNMAVLLDAVREGLRLLTWTQDSFAFADSFDEQAGRYRGLRCGQMVNVTEDNLTGLLVQPGPAEAQRVAENSGTSEGASSGSAAAGGETTTGNKPANGNGQAQPKRFYGTVQLDSTRVGRDAGRIADEVVAHLAGLMGADVKVTLEIEARLPNGAPDNVVRTVTENSRTLKFSAQGFEQD